MTMLELFVRYTDGRGETKATQRDDVAGRRYLDRVAWRLLASSRVAAVYVKPTTRAAGYARERSI